MEEIFNKYKGAIIYYVIIALLLFVSLKISEDNDELNLFDFCVIKSPNNAVKQLMRKTRGHIYWSNKKKNHLHQETHRSCVDHPSDFACGNCLVTSWNISHFLTYFGLGYLFPHLILECLLCGILFEFYESFDGSHDCLDIFWNSLGFLCGAILSPRLGK